MSIEEFKMLVTFYVTSDVFSEDTKQMLLDNLYKVIHNCG